MNSNAVPDKLRGVHESSQGDLVPWSPIQTPSVLKDGNYGNSEIEEKQRDSSTAVLPQTLNTGSHEHNEKEERSVLFTTKADDFS